jgi:hypothetical protein
MGHRLKGAVLWSKKRSTQNTQEQLKAKAQQAETQQVTIKKDDESFVIDTTALLPSKKQQEKKGKEKRNKNHLYLQLQRARRRSTD